MVCWCARLSRVCVYCFFLVRVRFLGCVSSSSVSPHFLFMWFLSQLRECLCVSWNLLRTKSIAALPPLSLWDSSSSSYSLLWVEQHSRDVEASGPRSSQLFLTLLSEMFLVHLDLFLAAGHFLATHTKELRPVDVTQVLRAFAKCNVRRPMSRFVRGSGAGVNQYLGCQTHWCSHLFVALR